MEEQRRDLDIAMLCHGWYPDVGGVESHTRDLARELGRRGHRVHALCLAYTGGREPYAIRDDDVEGVAVRRMAYLYHDHGALADVVSNGQADKVVETWLRDVRPDVLHVQHTTGFGMGALRAARGVGVPMVMTLHDYWPLCPRGQMMRVDRTVCAQPEAARCGECLAETWPHLMPSGGGGSRGPLGRQVDADEEAAALRTSFALSCLDLPVRLFSPSTAAREVYVAAGISAARIEVCENGIEASELARQVARQRLVRRPAEGRVRLGVLGTGLPSKGGLELARAFLAADVENLTLEFHGHLPNYHGDASYADELRALAAADERIEIHGPYDYEHLAEILAGLDGVAAPSRWVEVYGLTVREAAAAGLPVLVSDTGDLPAVAAEGRAGIVVPVDDHDGWVAALRRFGTDAEARQAWAGAAPPLRTVVEMTDQLEASYHDVAGAARRGLLSRWFGRRR